MRKLYILLLFTFCVITVNHAQTITGTISDKVTAEKLIGVNIIFIFHLNKIMFYYSIIKSLRLISIILIK